ncbi:pentraxin-related protein b6 isoform 2-T4 [Cochliomyia hominivorax]
MAIKGQQMYRLNYPLRVRQWHHACTSWNGKTGEWQVWLKAERIGRGFHNALVGHKIPAGGKLYSGGTSVTGKICDGLHFEVTLIQIYRVALSAGKAHRDHKHHHAHHFDHEGQEIQLTTKAPPPINRPQPMNVLLANGQIPTRVRINLAQPQQSGGVNAALPANQQPQQALTIHTNFVNGQINVGSRLVAQQLLGLNHKLTAGPQTSQTVNRQAVYDPTNPSKVQFVDETETRIIFKRQTESSKTKAGTGDKEDDKNLKKRGLVFLEDGSIVNDPLIEANVGDIKFDGLAEFGGQQFKNDLSGKRDIEDEIIEHDREPAEEEVKAVMALCNACVGEPFQGAIVFAWKDAHEKLDNVLKGYSVGGCGQF